LAVLLGATGRPVPRSIEGPACDGLFPEAEHQAPGVVHFHRDPVAGALEGERENLSAGVTAVVNSGG
jgi:hypothetical protein